MKRVLFLMAVVALVLCTPQPAMAEDYLGSVVAALQQSLVYVDPSTEGTDANTASDLRTTLYEDDNIVLVMLPESAQASIGVDPSSFAARISEKVGRQFIIGLSIGATATGYAPDMPTSVPEDLMSRAANVSTTPAETLGTFVRNVHGWQRDHPEAKASPHGKPFNFWPWLFGVLGLVAIGVGVMVGIRLRSKWIRENTGTSRKRFKAPKDVQERLTRIAEWRTKISDEEMRDLLFTCCTRIERYFAKYSEDHYTDALTFTMHLDNILVLLDKYVEVQDNRFDYRDPDSAMEDVRDRVSAFAQFVQDAILAGSDIRLADYDVNTDLYSQAWRKH